LGTDYPWRGVISQEKGHLKIRFNKTHGICEELLAPNGTLHKGASVSTVVVVVVVEVVVVVVVAVVALCLLYSCTLTHTHCVRVYWSLVAIKFASLRIDRICEYPEKSLPKSREEAGIQLWVGRWAINRSPDGLLLYWTLTKVSNLKGFYCK
jgi:hypothetical protein